MIMHYHDGKLGEAEDLIKKFHYSKRMPSNIQACITLHESGGLFGDYGPAVAACIFSIPPTRWSEDVWELSRLVRNNECDVPLTSLISKARGFLKGKIDLLVSFADYTQKHHGGIYQAASWNYSGKRERRMDGILKDGIFIPGRSCNSLWGTRSPEKLRERFDDIEPHYDEGKFIYWVAQNKAGQQKAKRLGLECLPYPKPLASKPAVC